MDSVYVILGVICVVVAAGFIYDNMKSKVDPYLKSVKDGAVKDAKKAVADAKAELGRAKAKVVKVDVKSKAVMDAVDAKLKAHLDEVKKLVEGKGEVK